MARTKRSRRSYGAGNVCVNRNSWGILRRGAQLPSSTGRPCENLSAGVAPCRGSGSGVGPRRIWRPRQVLLAWAAGAAALWRIPEGELTRMRTSCFPAPEARATLSGTGACSSGG